jgi:RNA polymerase sigma-70 factor (ECF subfamily)
VERVLLRYGTPKEEVQDLVQEVFLVAHRRGGFEPGAAKPSTWLSAIAVRVASDRRRQRARKSGRVRPDSDQVDRSASTWESPRQAAETTERLRRVRRALRQLTPPKRTVFVMFELKGQTCQEIADALHVPVGTVYSRLHDARRQFLRAYDAPEAIRPMAFGDSSIGGSE